MEFEEFEKIGLSKEKLEEFNYITSDRFEIYLLLSVGCGVFCYDRDENGVVTYLFSNKGRCQRVLARLKSEKQRVYMHRIIDVIKRIEAISNNTQKTELKLKLKI
jgi:hypothetical protein